MDRALEARDPGLARMFAIFTRLTRDDGPPLTERLARGPNLAVAAFRRSVRWIGTSAAAPIALVASLMVALVVLGIVTSGGSTCPPSHGIHQTGPAKDSVCPSSANGMRP
jgi:hypothetical protein